MSIQCTEVTEKKGMTRFICFPKLLYRNDRHFVFEPLMLQRAFFSEKNPFFAHSRVRYFLAEENGQVLGRVAAVTNTVHNETYGDKTGFFGFFDTIDDYRVAKLLLDRVSEIHLQNGFDKIIGPTNFTTNDSCGMLISGFDKPPVVLMPYNKPYYNDLLLRYGFEKEIDLAAWHFGDQVMHKPFFGRPLDGIGEKLKSAGISIRHINYKRLEREFIQMRQVYNLANAGNWGFVPLTEDEFRHMAFQLKSFVPEELVFIAEKDQNQIGFLVVLPDMNQVFRHIPSGKLLPFGWIKFLWYKRKITNARILILGIDTPSRNKGLDIMLYEKLRQQLIRMGIAGGEACYVLENNGKMNSILAKAGCSIIKEYRIYQLKLTV